MFHDHPFQYDKLNPNRRNPILDVNHYCHQVSVMTIQALEQYRGMTSSFGGTPPLDVGTGYGVVLGFGVFFSLFASFATFLDNRYAGTIESRCVLSIQSPAIISTCITLPNSLPAVKISTLLDAMLALDSQHV
jgi:hypothetical protein